MEGLRESKRSLKSEFFAAVSVTLLCVVLASAVTIVACRLFQKWLVPEENDVFLRIGYRTQDGAVETESYRIKADGSEQRIPYLFQMENDVTVPEKYDVHECTFAIDSIGYGIGHMGPRRKMAYIGAGIAMGVLPAAYSVTGFLMCALWFYRKKLEPGIAALDDAARHIGMRDLDFSVKCDLENELGELCRSFEKMRRALSENNREMWKMIEERKLIQASVAHDLRNPIAILEGYTEYMQLHLKTDGLSTEKIQEITENMGKAAKRLEQYTESVKEINQLDDIEIHRRRTDIGRLIPDITADLNLMARDAGKSLSTVCAAPSVFISIDAAILYRILENILSNALRYAEEKIEISFALQNNNLEVLVADDGCGFSEEILQSRNRLLMSAADGDGHCGIGLTISRILCQKHGGRLELANRRPRGAAVKIILEV